MRELSGRGIVIGLLLTLTTGCGDGGPTLVPVSGVVTYQDRPLAGAMVTFIPEGKGAIAMATTDNEGAYEIRTGASSGVIAGRSVVTVSLMSSGGKDGLAATMTPEDMQKMAMSGQLQKKLDTQSVPLIPELYSKATTSGLSYEVKGGQENKYNIPLK